MKTYKVAFALSLVFLLSFVFSNKTLAYEKELLNDPNFEKGVAVGFGNNYPNNLDQACIDKWKARLPSYSSIKWMFTEISERFYFCEEDNTNLGSPFVTNSRIEYVSPNYGMTKFIVDKLNKSVRMIYDTSWEWRGGCNLCMKWDLNGQTLTPRYGDRFTNWPHFLVGQILSPSYQPSQWDRGQSAIQDYERIYLTREYKKLMFSGRFKLNGSDKKNASLNCPPGDWKSGVDCGQTSCVGDCSFDVPDHAVFYIAFILWKKSWQSPHRIIYQLLPLVYTENGSVNVGGDGYNGNSYFVSDQFGDTTFFAKFGEGSTRDVKKLSRGQWVDINLDVLNFSKETLTKLNVSPDDYYLAGVLVGWEIWGGYNTDVEFKNISLIASIIPDLNSDGKVDIFDYNILVSNFGKTGSLGFIPSDINKDGRVDIFDYNILVGDFGR